VNDRLEPRIRILLGSSIAIGPGKAALLEAIEDTGSIAAAGRRMGMSYRRARLLAKTMTACLREPLIGAAKGGTGSGGARLTLWGAQSWACTARWRITLQIAFVLRTSPARHLDRETINVS
jgi:molybdate transport system regulatory protein